MLVVWWLCRHSLLVPTIVFDHVGLSYEQMVLDDQTKYSAIAAEKNDLIDGYHQSCDRYLQGLQRRKHRETSRTISQKNVVFVLETPPQLHRRAFKRLLVLSQDSESARADLSRSYSRE